MLTVLLHLPRKDPDFHAKLVEDVLRPAHEFVPFTLIRVPTSSLPRPRVMTDLESDEVLCAKTPAGLSPHAIGAFRNAVHSRFRNSTTTHDKLRCDLVGGDESRIRKVKGRRAVRRR
jgi:hypothetical protein